MRYCSPNNLFLVFSTSHQQLAIFRLNNVRKCSTPGLKASVLVQTPQLAVPTGPVCCKFGCVGLEYFHKFCLMLLCLSLRKTQTAPVGEDKSILVRLHNHPVGGGDEVPLGVILLVAVRLVVVGARGGLESDALFFCYMFSSHTSKLEVLTT